MEIINYLKLLERNVCPVCLKGNNLYKKDHLDFHKSLVESYCRSDSIKTKEIFNNISTNIWNKKDSIYFRLYKIDYNTALLRVNDNTMSSLGLYNHYKKNSGVELTLSQLGKETKDNIKHLISLSLPFKQFQLDLEKHAVLGFNHTYDFSINTQSALDPLLTMRNAKIIGSLKNSTLLSTSGNKFLLNGYINIDFSCEFTDPQSIFNWFGKDWNADGTPFKIKDNLTILITYSINKADVEKYRHNVSAWRLIHHFFEKSQQTLTLSEIGLEHEIRRLVGHLGISDRFQSQIESGERVTFRNTYDFSTEANKGIYGDALWAIRNATICGRLEDIEVELLYSNRYNIKGFIKYKFYDEFTDPIDIFNWVETDINLFGKPFNIIGEWREYVSFLVEKDVYDNKIKELMDLEIGKPFECCKNKTQ
ncbi:hypothetical protein [Xenorhabdus eapokensis]|uniref:Uncharacterized protein n=1 Tax=Xenorhabdus eapokensis TaxID=1873482 RepID=A0A1Q5TKR0_9GAMM|nr:hypothetical protein [Xenorhabdus eapokensis]OKP00805.1 hypothetical protein Xedl_03119 [Xenorhabdus eapokensis]